MSIFPLVTTLFSLYLTKLYKKMTNTLLRYYNGVFYFIFFFSFFFFFFLNLSNGKKIIVATKEKQCKKWRFPASDIDECLEPGRCSQFCLNEKSSFKCICAPGYFKDPRNHTRCKAAEGHASLLFTRRHDIRKVALDRLEMTNIVKDTKMAAALDFVFRTGMIFWSDSSEKKIYK